MIKVGMAALTAISMNTTNISASDYKNMLEKVSDDTKKEINKEVNFYLNDAQKEHLKNINANMLETISKYKEHNENVFKDNFQRWIIEDGENTKFLVNLILNMSNEFSSEFTKEARYYKKYPSLAKLLQETADIYKDIYNFTKKYKKEADESFSTYSFMSSFIKENEEVLEALA